MQEIKNGRVEKLGILYDKYKQPLYTYFINAMNIDKSSAEDLLQDVFYKIVKNKELFKVDNFASWLFRIARNIAIDFHRKQKHRFEIKDFHQELDDADFYADEQKYDLLEKSIDRLKFEERELLVMAKIKCLKYKDIAEVLQISEINVRVKVSRAIHSLRKTYFFFF